MQVAHGPVPRISQNHKRTSEKISRAASADRFVDGSIGANHLGKSNRCPLTVFGVEAGQ